MPVHHMNRTHTATTKSRCTWQTNSVFWKYTPVSISGAGNETIIAAFCRYNCFQENRLEYQNLIPNVATSEWLFIVTAAPGFTYS